MDVSNPSASVLGKRAAAAVSSDAAPNPMIQRTVAVPSGMGRMQPMSAQPGVLATLDAPLTRFAKKKASKLYLPAAITSNSGGHAGLAISNAAIASTVLPDVGRSNADQQYGTVGVTSGSMTASAPNGGSGVDRANRSDAVIFPVTAIPRPFKSDPFMNEKYVTVADANVTDLHGAWDLMSYCANGVEIDQRIGNLVSVSKIIFRGQVTRSKADYTGPTNSCLSTNPTTSQLRLTIVVADSELSAEPVKTSFGCPKLVLPSYSIVYDETFTPTYQGSWGEEKMYLQGQVLFPKPVIVRFGDEVSAASGYPKPIQNGIYFCFQGTSAAATSAENPMAFSFYVTTYYKDK